MNEIQVFKNEKFGEVRTAEIEGKIYFVGSDVAKALGYTNPPKAITDHCKGITKWSILTKGGMQEMNVIPQGDIYRLVAKSQLPGAEEFERWIFDEVLVSVANHGGYLTPSKIEEILTNPDFIIDLAQTLKKERAEKEALLQKTEKQQKVIDSQQKKVEFIDRVLDTDEKIDIGQAAKILELPFGRNKLFAKLREMGVFFKNRNEPKQVYVEKGYFTVKERWIERDNHDGFMVLKILVSQSGLSFLSELFPSEQSSKKQLKLT